MSKSREWLECREATAFLSRKSGRPIHEGVVRDRAAKGQIRKRLKPGYIKVNLYYRPDLERLCPIRPLRGKRTAVREPIRRAQEEIQDYAPLIEAVYRANPTITVTGVEKQLGCARTTAWRYLKPLRQADSLSTAEKPEDGTRTQ